MATAEHGFLISRRDFVVAGGAATMTMCISKLAGWLAMRSRPDDAAIDRVTIRKSSGYHNGLEMVRSLGPHSLDPCAIPPPPSGSPTHVALTITDSVLHVTASATVQAWALNGAVPGPTLRVAEGQELEVRLTNLTSVPHNIHFHGSFDVAIDDAPPVPPQGTETYRLRPQYPGFHPYHCHVAPVAGHIMRGMYGALIVDPPEGTSQALERVLLLSGWDTDEDGRNEFYAWNGIPNYYSRFPIVVPRGMRLRLYVANCIQTEPAASFHLHAQTFNVVDGPGNRRETDVVALGPFERAILEMVLPRRGRYMFHPHHSYMAENGAVGWLVAS